MASYGYIAIDKEGKELKGSIDGDSSESVTVALRQKGWIPIEIKEQSLLTKDLEFDFFSSVSPRDLSVFCRQFHSMFKSGVTILEALRLLTQQTESKKLKKAVRDVQLKVEKGESLAASLGDHPNIFPKLMITTIAAGEASGSIEIAFERMAVHFEKAAKTRALIKKAMIYPAVVAIVAVAVVIVMLVVVIPNYTSMFDDLGIELPALTVAVINASDFIIHYWYVLLPVVIGIVFGVRVFIKSPMGQLTVGRLAIRLPIVKNLSVKSASSQLARTLSTLISSGVPLIEAVEITANTMGNVLYKNALLEAKDQIVRGVPLSGPLEECMLFPPMVYHMINIGEEAGTTEEMLEKLADYYDEEVEMATQSLMAAMEPMIIIVMAGIVGVLIAAVMAPMMEMYTGLDNL